MDDEKYFTFSGTKMPQNSFFYSSGKKKDVELNSHCLKMTKKF